MTIAAKKKLTSFENCYFVHVYFDEAKKRSKYSIFKFDHVVSTNVGIINISELLVLLFTENSIQTLSGLSLWAVNC